MVQRQVEKWPGNFKPKNATAAQMRKVLLDPQYGFTREESPLSDISSHHGMQPNSRSELELNHVQMWTNLEMKNFKIIAHKLALFEQRYCLYEPKVSNAHR